MTSDYIVAVEIGSSKIKGAVGRIEPSGTLSVIGIEEEHQNPNYVRYGCVQNVKEVANELNRILTRLSSRLDPDGSTISGVYVSVGGRSLKSTPTRLRMQMREVTEVTSEIVSDLLGRARVDGSDLDLLDVEPVSYFVDGKKQGTTPVGVLGNEIAAQVNLVSCRSQMLRNLHLAVNEKLNIRINDYVVHPMAVADLVLTSDEKRLGVMLVDCGAETTTVAIYKGGAMIYLVTIPIGSRHITRDIASTHYTEERAEELKRTVGNAAPDNGDSAGSTTEIDTSAINNHVRARAAEIMANIKAQVEYAGLTASDLPKGVVVVGGGSMLRGFAETLESVMGMSVRRGSLPSSVRLTGTKITTGEDIDIIALLYRLAQEPSLKPCVAAPRPEGEDVGEPDDEPEDDDYTIEDSDDDRKGKKKGGNFFTRFFGGRTAGSSVFDDEDENFANNE